MLNWYRGQMKEHGWAAATGLLGRVVWTQTRARLSNKLLPAHCECPCCGWTGRRFYDYLETGYRVPNAACPRCDSHGRHRLLYWWLTHDFPLAQQSGLGLVVAPERALAEVWRAAPRLRVLRTDLEAARNVDFCADVQHLPLPDGAFTLLWCHHVLEQVPDDNAALREFRRVLAHEGRLVISAGLHAQPHTTEFGHSDKGLSGNRRRYGADFAGRVRANGFQVAVGQVSLTPPERARYGIAPEESFFICDKSDLPDGLRESL